MSKLRPDDPFARGRRIGGGCFREVYVAKHWPKTRVVKVCQEGDEDMNRAEWDIWQAAPREARKLLAPCYAISDDGKHLLMRRTRPPTIPDLWNFRVPAALNCDLHRLNMGKICGRVVIHDYAGWNSKDEAELRKLVQCLTDACVADYSRPDAINITDAERRQYGLA